MSENGFIPPFSGFSVNCDPNGGNCFFAVNVFKPVSGCPNRLHAMNFLHRRGVCHRDLSYRNVLVHTYRGSDAFMVKVSDFGLAKEKTSDLTSTGSSMKGSIIDPALKSFRDFKPVNDIYSIGFILNYILTGKENLVTDGSRLDSIIQKCSAANPADRYRTVKGIIEDMRKAECLVG